MIGGDDILKISGINVAMHTIEKIIQDTHIDKETIDNIRLTNLYLEPETHT